MYRDENIVDEVMAKLMHKACLYRQRREERMFMLWSKMNKMRAHMKKGKRYRGATSFDLVEGVIYLVITAVEIISGKLVSILLEERPKR